MEIHTDMYSIFLSRIFINVNIKCKYCRINGNPAIVTSVDFIYFIWWKEYIPKLETLNLPRRGGKGGSFGRRMSPITLPAMTAQMNSTTMPNRLPPGSHSFTVMDHTTPKRTAAMVTADNGMSTVNSKHVKS